jgi:hypothetical protein
MSEEALWTKEADGLMQTVKSVVNFQMEYVIYKLGGVLCLITVTAYGDIKHSLLDLCMGV